MITNTYTKAFLLLVALSAVITFVVTNKDIKNAWDSSHRQMSVNLGGGNCMWTPPAYEGIEATPFYKTIIAGYPSGDKRLTFVQMEALTELPAKDEWDFQYLGITNHPFIKANYPHHEGIWGWGDVGDQVVMVVRNIKRAMVEYHDILWDIGYAKTWEQATELIPNLYAERPPLTDFTAWREERVLDEIKWYGWFIDFYMEGGLMRDIFTNKITTPKHWYMLMMPTVYTVDELRYDKVVGDDSVIVEPSYDPNCALVSNGCEPVKVISAERLVDIQQGPAVGLEIANVLEGREGMSVIEPEARGCIWRELIVNKKGLKTFIDRDGYGESDYSFTQEQLQKMVTELTRLINKYGSFPWDTKETAQTLVDLLTDHRNLISADLEANRFRKMQKRVSSPTPERFQNIGNN
mmetsp:Transcript_32752/g.43667  ORF Transcript_32752/g.43667 Transcript_32752/m.43667 type:complete len:407 (-) Transcript_32752:106-1326(-)